MVLLTLFTLSQPSAPAAAETHALRMAVPCPTGQSPFSIAESFSRRMGGIAFAAETSRRVKMMFMIFNTFLLTC